MFIFSKASTARRFAANQSAIQTFIHTVFVFVTLSVVASTAQAQRELNIVRELRLQGTLESLTGDRMQIVDVDGKRHDVRIQSEAGKPIGLTGGETALEQLAAIKVRGTATPNVLEPGMIVQVNCQIGLAGKTGVVSSIELLPGDSPATGVSFAEPPQGAALVDAQVIGAIKSVNKKRLVIEIPKHEFVPRESLTLEIDTIAEISYLTNSLQMLRTGDVVVGLDAAELSTGDSVVRRIEMELVGTRADLRLTSEERLQLKYRDESDLPGQPREMRSENFLMVTDASDRQSKILLEKLETMFGLLGDYYERQPEPLIECYVVDDVGKWDTRDWDPGTLLKVEQGEGRTIYARQGRVQKTVVFSANNHDVAQHEAVHGFCFLTFDGTGPLWYSEGMAEMGQYWKPNDRAVAADPAEIAYLTSRSPLPLMEIVKATTIEGENWKAYAWRWALCHFLANNGNYADRFKRLGVSLMRSQKNASFENMFRSDGRELNFEYNLFMKDLEPGLRVDLCTWDWDTKTRKPSTARALTKKIEAARGWQATGCLMEPGVNYSLTATGTWKLSEESGELDANGGEQGEGRLIGVILNDYELSDEFELGTDSKFTPPSRGHLYVRCQERMSQIADNEGKINLAVKRLK